MPDHQEQRMCQTPITDLESMDARVATLEKRLADREGIRQGELDAGVATAVQSIGVVVDFLAARGLIDKDDLRKHIEHNFLLTETDEVGDRAETAIDIYGWLIWSESSRFLRQNARRIQATG